jgi:hypothetical protein
MGVHGYYDGDVINEPVGIKPSGAGVLGYANPDPSKS